MQVLGILGRTTAASTPESQISPVGNTNFQIQLYRGIEAAGCIDINQCESRDAGVVPLLAFIDFILLRNLLRQETPYAGRPVN